MRKVLHIFDSKQLLYGGVMKRDSVLSTGMVENEGRYSEQTISVGPLSYALNELYKVKGMGDVVLCHDSPPTIKRELMDGIYPGNLYKGNRSTSKFNACIPLMFRWFKEIIDLIDYPHIKVEGYEADDIIHSVVKRYYDSYDEIIIHSNDNDQYALVDGKVHCAAVTSKGKNVTLNTYEASCKLHGITPYNTVFLYKLVEGDVQHNNVPKITKAMSAKILESTPVSTHKYLGELPLLRTIVRNAVDGDTTVTGTLDLILPLDVPYSEIELCEDNTNWDMFNFFADQFSVGAFLRDRASMGMSRAEVRDDSGLGVDQINKMFRDKEREDYE